MTNKARAKRSEHVWLVGGRVGSVCPDVYASEESALAAVMRYIFEDENDHWLGKLKTNHRKIVEAVRDNPEMAIDAYNSFASEDDKWVISECEVYQ